MTKQEEIKEYFESSQCAEMNQHCSDCQYSRKDGDYCYYVKEYAGEVMQYLHSQGVVIKTSVLSGKITGGDSYTMLEPLIEEKE